jgi:hypothetical protein
LSHFDFEIDNQNQSVPHREENTMPVSPCCRTVLARGPSAEVARCSCGHLHLSLGPVTIRLDEDTLHAAWHTVGDALRALREESAGAHAPEPQPGAWKQ